MPKRTDNRHSKSDRALELFEKGLAPPAIAARLGTSPSSIHALLRNAKARRDQIERAGKLADIMGPNV